MCRAVPYQYAPVQVAVLQVHSYPDDAHVGPRPLAVIGRVVAAGDRSAMGFDGRRRGQRDRGGLVGGRGGVHVQAGD